VVPPVISFIVELVTSEPLANIRMSCMDWLYNIAGSENATITYMVVFINTEEFVNPGEQSVVLHNFTIIWGDVTKLQFKHSLVNDSTNIDLRRKVSL
jgi:hypothetical protein